MRTIRTKVYRFSELKEAAKQTAIDKFREYENYDYLINEAFETVERFAKRFDISIRDFDFLEHYRRRYTFDMEDNILELSCLRLRTYLINNYYDLLFERKHYGKYEKRENDKWRYDRYSKCQFVETCCPFTGVCYDEDILAPIREYIKKPTNNDFKDLLEDCLSEVCKSIEGEINARNEDDAIAETIEANEYEFTSDGRMI